MRPVTLRQSALGASRIIPHTWGVYGAGALLRAQFINNPATVLTYSVEHTFDDMYAIRIATFTRVTTTLTVTLTDHGLATNDHVGLTLVQPNNFKSTTDLPISQTSFLPTVLTANTFTVPVLNQGPASGSIGITGLRMVADATLAAQTASGQVLLSLVPEGSRVRVTAYTSGGVDFTVTSTAP